MVNRKCGTYSRNGSNRFSHYEECYQYVDSVSETKRGHVFDFYPGLFSIELERGATIDANRWNAALGEIDDLFWSYGTVYGDRHSLIERGDGEYRSLLFEPRYDNVDVMTVEGEDINPDDIVKAAKDLADELR